MHRKLHNETVPGSIAAGDCFSCQENPAKTSYSLSLEPSTFTILWMYIFFMFSRAGFRY